MLIQNTVKGQLINRIMLFNFLFDLAGYLTSRDRYNVTSLYMIKYNLGCLYYIRSQLQQKNNFINHPKWK